MKLKELLDKLSDDTHVRVGTDFSDVKESSAGKVESGCPELLGIEVEKIAVTFDIKLHGGNKGK